MSLPQAERPSRVFSSPLRRCRETAAPPAAADLERTAGLQKASVRRDAQLRGADRRSAGRPARAGARTPSAIGACEAARKKRDRELAAMGKAGRKIEIRRAADVQVASACR